MENLFEDIYVIYNPKEDYVIRWRFDVGIVIYGDKEEAEEDCRGDEIVASYNELPNKYQIEIRNQFTSQYF
jgi:hypothetical protein